MTDRAKIVAIYGTVAALSAVILGTGIYLGTRVPDQPMPVFSDVGAEKTATFFPIRKDFAGVNQSGENVRLSDLRGKVWLVAEFFAVCPHCAVRNGQELKSLFDEFKDHPDFHIVCISVDPTTDTTERLAEYSKALGADPSRWWFVSHPDEKATHEYMEKTLGFFGIRERKDPAEIEANGRFAHDLGIMLVDREWNVVGKWPLADARSEEGRARDPHLYERLRDELRLRVSGELEKNETAGIEKLSDEPDPAAPPADE
jgi:protein SCO1/2